MKNVENREGLWICIEFEAKHFLGVCIDCTILESPKKTHEECEPAEMVIPNIQESSSEHESDDWKIEKNRGFTSEFIYCESDKEASQNLTNSKEDHS